MDSNSVTIETLSEENDFGSAKDVCSFAEKDAKQSFTNFKLKEDCVAYECTYSFSIPWQDISYLFIEKDFHIRNLGYLPDSAIEKINNGSRLLITKDKQTEADVKNNSDLFVPDYETEYFDINDYRNFVSFIPSSRANVFVLPISDRQAYRTKKQNSSLLLYYLLHLPFT